MENHDSKMEERTSKSDERISRAEDQIRDKSKRVDFYISEYPVEVLVEKLDKNDLTIPDYQREFIWDKRKQSRFIESILMGLPISFLFFWENNDDGKLEIVDGTQRLSTLSAFLNNKLELSELEELDELNGFKFADLNEGRQRKFKNRSIRGIILDENTDEGARFDLFERINTGSENASRVEVRRGAFPGRFMDLVKDLSKDKTFIKIAPAGERAKKRREHEELITRFFAYSGDLSDYKDRPSDFLDHFTKKMNTALQENPAQIDQFKRDFDKMVSFIAENCKFGFRKSQDATTTPRSRFEAISVGTIQALKSGKPIDIPSIPDWITSEEFIKITGSDGANAKRRLSERINYVKAKLVGEG